MTNEEYTKLDIPEGVVLEPCPVCGAVPELWQHWPKGEGATKVVMCPEGDNIGPQVGLAHSGCPMYMPSNESYRPTIREAVSYWNQYAWAIAKLRARNANPPKRRTPNYG